MTEITWTLKDTTEVPAGMHDRFEVKHWEGHIKGTNNKFTATDNVGFDCVKLQFVHGKVGVCGRFLVDEIGYFKNMDAVRRIADEHLSLQMTADAVFNLARELEDDRLRVDMEVLRREFGIGAAGDYVHRENVDYALQECFKLRYLEWRGDCDEDIPYQGRYVLMMDDEPVATYITSGEDHDVEAWFSNSCAFSAFQKLRDAYAPVFDRDRLHYTDDDNRFIRLAAPK